MLMRPRWALQTIRCHGCALLADARSRLRALGGAGDAMHVGFRPFTRARDLDPSQLDDDEAIDEMLLAKEQDDAGG
jgi:hypothetical protein